MKEFYYIESSRKNAIQGLVVWLFVFSTFAAIIFLNWESNQVFLKYVSYFIFFVATISIIALVKIYKSDGYWEVSIKNSQLIWRTPNNKKLWGESPFDLDLSKIKKVIGEEYRRLDEVKVNYQIVLANGDVHHLITNSNIQMTEIIEVLKNNGVLYEHKKI